MDSGSSEKFYDPKNSAASWHFHKSWRLFFSALFFKSWFGAAHRVVGHKLSIISLHVTIFRRSSSVVQYSLWFILELVKERVVKSRTSFSQILYYVLPHFLSYIELNKYIFGAVIFEVIEATRRIKDWEFGSDSFYH